MPRMPALSPHAEALTDQLYSPLMERAQASGRPIRPLHIGDTWREPYEGARVDRIASRERPWIHTYAPVAGEPELRRAFSDHLRETRGLAVSAEQLQVTAGATSGFAAAVNTLFDVGDEVLVPAPYWPLIRGLIASRGAVPVELPFFDQLGDPTFDVERELERRVTSRTVAIYLNAPNNPSGATMSAEHLDAIARLAARHDLWVLADEAYADLVFDGSRTRTLEHPTLAARTLGFHTLSKSHGIAGARIGFVHGPDAVMRAIRGMQLHLAYCAPRPMQWSAVAALRDGRGWVEETLTFYRDAAASSARVFHAETPAAGTFLFVDVTRWLPRGSENSGAFLEACADRGVLLTPGSVSGRDYARWVRVCFTSVAPTDLASALAEIRAVISASSS